MKKIKNLDKFDSIHFSLNYTNPIEPAVKPTIKKNENSKRSRGREFIINLK